MTTPSTVTVTPFTAADPEAMLLPERVLQAFESLEELRATWRHYETAGPAWTLRVGDTIVGCAGLMLLWPRSAPKVAHAWLIPSNALPQYPKTVVEELVTRCRALIDQYGLHRIQLEVQADYQVGNRFVQWLGFEPDGTPEHPGLMRKYGPHGEDFMRYALVRSP